MKLPQSNIYNCQISTGKHEVVYTLAPTAGFWSEKKAISDFHDENPLFSIQKPAVGATVYTTHELMNTSE